MSGNSTGSDPDTALLLDTHIIRAESIVNGYLISRYSLPFATVPPYVRTLTEDVTAFYAIRGAFVQNGQLANNTDEKYKLALEPLEMLRDGDVGLTLTDSSLAPTRGSRYLSSTKDFTPIVQLDTDTSWHVDPDQLDEISESRK